MLTANADGHPIAQRFRKPEDEKRMVAILDPAHYDGVAELRQAAQASAILHDEVMTWKDRVLQARQLLAEFAARQPAASFRKFARHWHRTSSGCMTA